MVNERLIVEILIKTGKPENIRTSLMAVFLFQESRNLDSWLKGYDRLCDSRISAFLKLKDFKGDLNESAMLYMPENAGIRRILLVGLGKKKEFNIEKVRQVFGTAAKLAKSKKIKRFTLSLTGFDSFGFSKYELARTATEGAVLSLYNFNVYKTGNNSKNENPKQITLFDIRRTYLNKLRTGAKAGGKCAEAVCYARDLASHPSNILTPSYLADEAKNISDEAGLECTVLGEKELKKKKMNALLAVAKGSVQEPGLIILKYDCGRKDAETVALVGKGLTFDSGGISIKSSKKMEEMKYDMSGAASVIATMKLIGYEKPPVNVIGVLAAAENMPGGNAVKPGDIIKTYSGKTVEIINTDAEGRLVLCDALAYVIDSYKPNAVINIATLTGAVVVALGHYSTGLLGNNPGLLKRIQSAGEESGEMVWELPLYPEYDEHIKSEFADIKNSNGPGAGTIFGASFLKQFVGKIPWAHLDIAGTAYNVKEKSYLPKGPTGVGVRLFSRLLQNWK